MPGNGFNLGSDTNLDVIGPKGTIRLSILTSFDPKALYKDLDSVAIDGTNRFFPVPAGHEGAFELDRADNVIDDFLASNEADFYAGLAQSTMTITQTIRELSGAVSQYQYTGVTLKVTDRGAWKGVQKVNVKVSFKASFFKKLA